MMTAIAFSFSLALLPPAELQQTAEAPKTNIEIVRDLSTRLKKERATHQRDFAADLQTNPLLTKGQLNIYRQRIGNTETKKKEHTTSTAGLEAMVKRLGDALDRIDQAREADKAARTTDAIEAFQKEGMFKQLLQRIQGQPQNEAIQAMKKIVAVLNNDVIDAYKLNAEFSEMLTQQKEQLANCERAAAREDAAQRKLGGLNLSIFVLDGAMSLFDIKPTAK